jgi:ectoine hydroxylase-related dioxygenase (phytanoyl-CoA dioxygenase family)
MLMRAAVSAFERDGFVLAGRVLEERQVAAARDAADTLLAEHGAASDYGVIALEASRRAATFHELLPPVASVACELLATEVVVAFQDLVIDKPRRAVDALPWHQDQTYLPLDRDDGLVAWVALDDADEARGCMRYVPGSHLLGPRAPAEFAGGSLPNVDGLPPIDVDGRPVVVAEAAAGEAWFHTPLTWHASPPNRAAASRRAWSIWFVREETRWAPDRAPHPYLVELTPSAGAPLAGDRFPRFRR